MENIFSNLKEQSAKLKAEIPILDYFFGLEKRGALKFEGKKGKEYFFGFSHQRTGSIAVRDSSNLWFDHSRGIGGDIIKAVQVFEGKNFVEAINHLVNRASIGSPIIHKVPKHEGSKFKIIQELETIEHPALIQYLNSRGLGPTDLSGIAKEIHWLKKDSRFFGIGFRTDKGGYAVRSSIFKGNINTGGISSIEVGNGPTGIKIFEGCFDFASFKKLNPDLSYHAVVLNSTANFTLKLMTAINDKAKDLNMEVNLYLDNDPTGDEKTKSALQIIEKAQDRRSLFKGYEDLNQFLIERQKIRIGR